MGVVDAPEDDDYGVGMGEIVAFEWVSADGVFDSDPAYFTKWFLPFHSEARATCIRDTVEGASALLMGRRTYEMLAPFWSAQTDDSQGPARALNRLPKYVASTTLSEARWENTADILRNDVADAVARVKGTFDGTTLVVGSASLLTSLLRADLIDTVRLLVHPYVMGEGRRWTSEATPATGLELVDVEPLDAGVVKLEYRLRPS